MNENYDKGDHIEFESSEHGGDDLSVKRADSEVAEHPAKPLTFMRLPAYVMTA